MFDRYSDRIAMKEEKFQKDKHQAKTLYIKKIVHLIIHIKSVEHTNNKS